MSSLKVRSHSSRYWPRPTNRGSDEILKAVFRTPAETIFSSSKRIRCPLSNQNPESLRCRSAKLVRGAQVPRKEIEMCHNQLMKMADVAYEAQIPIRTIYYLNQMGRGPKTVSVGRHLRVRRSDFDEWLVAQEN